MLTDRPTFDAEAMVVRQKRIGRYVYVYLVETVREDGQIKQRIIRNLGRKEDVERRGDLDRLVRSAARLAQRSIILSPSTRPASPPRLQPHRPAVAVRASLARQRLRRGAARASG